MMAAWVSRTPGSADLEERGRGRTTAAQTPATSQPMRCASQLTPSVSQKLVWSPACWLSEGQSVLLDESDITAEGESLRRRRRQ